MKNKSLNVRGLHPLNKQCGGALLIIMTVLVLVMVSVFFSQLDSAKPTLVKSQRNIEALASAKSALISFALISDRVSGSPGIGYLPCPDSNGDGISNAPCGNVGESVEGWLPWQTLGIKPVRDAAFTCLRYAVSGNYKISPSSVLSASPPSAGHFVIHNSDNTIRVGSDASEYALAVIFSGGATHSGQSRSLGGGSSTECGSSSLSAAKNNASNYLDSLSGVNNALGTHSGASGAGSASLPTSNVSVFIQANAQDGFNDLLAWVSPQDFSRVYARMP